MMLIDCIESLLIVGLIPITVIIAVVALIERLPINLSAAHRSWLWRSVYVKAATLALLPAWCVVPFSPFSYQASLNKSSQFPSKTDAVLTNVSSLEQSGEARSMEGVVSEEEVTLGTNSFPAAIIGPLSDTLINIRNFLRASRVWWVPLWGFGFLTLLFLGVREYFRLRREIACGATQAQANVLSLAITTARKLGVRGNPRLRLSNQVNSPLLLMGPRIELVLPTDFDQRFGCDACQMAIAHELAHYHRRDLFWNILVSLVTAAFFFWPPIWFAGRRYYVAMEMACDQFAIRRAKLDLIEYANLLIRLLEPASQRNYPSAVLSMAWSGTFRSLSERIRFMKMEAKSRNAVRLIASAFSLAIALLIVIPWGLAEDKPKKNKKNESITDSNRYDKEKIEQPKKKSSSASASASSSFFGFGSSSGSSNGSFDGGSGSGASGGNAGAQSNGNVIVGGSAKASVSMSEGGDEAEEKVDYFISPGDASRIPVPASSGMMGTPYGTKSPSSSASSKVNSVNGTTVTRTIQEDEDGEKVSITTVRNKKTEVTIRECESDGILVGITDLRKGQKKTPQFFESANRESLKKEHPEAYEWVKKYGDVSTSESSMKPNLGTRGSIGSAMMGSSGGSSFASGSSFGEGAAGSGVNLDGGLDAKQLLKLQIRQMLEKTDDPLTRQNLEQLLRNVDVD